MKPQDKPGSWVREPKYDNWGFKAPYPGLVKIVIDLRSKESQPTYGPPLESHGPNGPDLYSLISEYQRAKAYDPSYLRCLKIVITNSQQNMQTKGQPARLTHIPEFPRKENEPPGSPRHRNFHPFGNDIEGPGYKYFGGPILDTTIFRWRRTHYTRACGEVIGARESNIPLPLNIEQIVKSVAVLSSNYMSQTAIWIGPRLLLSTLHIHHWIRGHPSFEECDIIRKEGNTFDVESEICSHVLSTFSPKVQLVDFSVPNDIGIFKLQDHYPPISDYVNMDWLLERDEMYERYPKAAQKVACVGYSGKIGDQDALKIKNEAAVQLRRTVPQHAFLIEPIDLDMVTKPSMKSFAPGTLDFAAANGESMIWGVSASLWKGSSGGPCIVLDGEKAGGIIGLVRGYDLLSDPYNLVNGFPTGLKQALKNKYSSQLA